MEPGLFRTRHMLDDDAEPVARLLDEAMGPGFWSLDADQPDIRRVALSDDRIVGVAIGRVEAHAPAIVDIPAPVGTVRLVAVDHELRRQGVATRLVTEVCREGERLGAVSLLAFAWVHAPSGVAPLSSVLERLGFTRGRRIADFYGGATQAPCPACGRMPCVCAADVYYRLIDREGRNDDVSGAA